MGVAVDCNVLVRYFTHDDKELAKKSEQIIGTAKSGSLVLDRLVIAELGYVLRASYGFKKEQITPVFRWLFDSSAFSIVDRELTELAVSLFVTELPLSFVDCWLLALKRTSKVKNVATFDAALLKRL